MGPTCCLWCARCSLDHPPTKERTTSNSPTKEFWMASEEYWSFHEYFGSNKGELVFQNDVSRYAFDWKLVQIDIELRRKTSRKDFELLFEASRNPSQNKSPKDRKRKTTMILSPRTFRSRETMKFSLFSTLILAISAPLIKSPLDYAFEEVGELMGCVPLVTRLIWTSDVKMPLRMSSKLYLAWGFMTGEIWMGNFDLKFNLGNWNEPHWEKIKKSIYNQEPGIKPPKQQEGLNSAWMVQLSCFPFRWNPSKLELRLRSWWKWANRIKEESLGGSFGILAENWLSFWLISKFFRYGVTRSFSLILAPKKRPDERQWSRKTWP